MLLEDDAKRRTVAPLTLFGEELRQSNRSGGSIFARSLKPGEEMTVKLQLNRVFDMTVAGQYRISAERKLRRSNDLKVASNELEIAVANPPQGSAVVQ